MSDARLTPRVQGALSLVLMIAGAAGLWYVAQSSHPIPEFREYVAGAERKTVFFGYMRPLIEAENKRIHRDRERLQAYAAKNELSWLDRRRLSGLAAEYGLDDSVLSDSEVLDRLLRRVDTVPLSLAMAQAAKESGWGTSRFAREGNNFFGEWCFEAGCGIVPKARQKGRKHEVEAFSSPRRSVESYIRNLNSHPSYRSFRMARAQLRAEQRPLSGAALAEHLSKYSERREAYVRELKQIILVNDLDVVVSDDTA